VHWVWLVVALVAVAWLALGPWVLVAAVVTLVLPRVGPRARAWLRPADPRRTAALAVAVLVAGAGVVWAVPDGRLPIPPGTGTLVLPDYVGRPAVRDPIAAQDPPQHPHLAPDGTSWVHGDAWASDASGHGGPLGRQPVVDTASYGAEHCAGLAFDSHQRLVARCEGPGGPRLRVVDPDTMRPLATTDLSERGELPDVDGAEEACGRAFHLDDRDRVVLPTADRRILAIRTADAEGQPDLTVDGSWDLADHVPESDCVVALLPDWSGRTWFTTHGGLVGTLDQRRGRVRTLDLGAAIDTSFAVDENGGVFVVTRTALHRLSAGPDGVPGIDWTTRYDRGTRQKPGQPGQGSGTAPTIVDGGAVAIADNAEPRMNVLFVDRSTGVEICRTPVLGADEAATGPSLASVGSGVVVANHHGYASPWRTLLGRGTSPGMARVELEGRDCRVDWTRDVVSPSGPPRVSWPDGLVYAWTKQPTWTGVAAWYLTALDAATGRTRFSVRAGTGVLFDNDRAAVTLAPDGSAWTGTLGGLVRIRDRD
jgi:hypothetical protein